MPNSLTLPSHRTDEAVPGSHVNYLYEMPSTSEEEFYRVCYVDPCLMSNISAP